MAIQGTLKTMSLTDLLQFLAAGRKTGTLKFDRANVSKQVYFENGMIVGSKSNDPREYLGQVLLHYGKVDENQLQAALDIQRKTGARLGEVLVQQGFLTDDEVLEMLKTRTLDAIYDLFVWNEGDFEFYDDEALPADLILLELEPTNLIMEGIYRLDELARYRTLVPSDRSLIELGPGWTSSLKLGKEYRRILYFVEKRMSVAEICYHMHASAFHVYGQLYTLIAEGVARVAGELPEESMPKVATIEDLPESVTEMIWSAQKKLDSDPEAALAMVQKALKQQPNNADAHELLLAAEERYVKHVYANDLLPQAVPQLLVAPSDLQTQQIDPQEGFVLSRINGTWDIQSILSICPFREADCLRMIRDLLKRGIIGLT
jgi:tetratricopeptide (TPR) repeat protein